MKLGFVSAIVPEYTLDQVLSFAHKAGFSSVELMCWPPGKAERRYAGRHPHRRDQPVPRRDREDPGPAGHSPGRDLRSGLLSQPAFRPIEQRPRSR